MLTLQSGTLSNFVGSHFWNLVDENDESSELFTDDQHNLFYVESTLEMGPLGFEEVHPEEIESSTQNIKIMQQEKVELHEYQKHLLELELNPHLPSRDNFNWETSVRFWCDFWKSKEFPKSRLLLPPSHDLSSRYWFETERNDFDFAESPLRTVLERMDVVHSITSVSDLADGFSDSSIELAEFIQDELPKKKQLVFLPFKTDALLSVKSRDHPHFFLNFVKLFDLCHEKSTIAIQAAPEATPFARSAFLGASLYNLTKVLELPVTLMQISGNFEESEGIKQHIQIPIPFPSQGKYSGDFVVKEEEGGAKEILIQAEKEMKRFRVSGELRKFPQIEIDDWLGLEENIQETRENLWPTVDEEEEDVD